MPRTRGAAVQNNFIGGLKTEFTGLNFPENSATQADNVVFDRTGNVKRRRGIDKEDGGIYETLDRTESAVTSYVWLNASGDGFTNLLVLQVKDRLRFYEASDPSTPLSGQLLASSIDLTGFLASGAVGPISTEECQFSQGNGFLFVFHPKLDRFSVSYNTGTQVVTGTVINIQIRDFTGISEPIITQRPTTLTATHRYNLGNQGWRSGFTMLSTSSITTGTGSKVFTTDLSSSTTPVINGTPLRIYSSGTPADFMTGVVTSFSGTTLTVNVTAATGAGVHADWIITQNPDNILTWFNAVANYPSNADVWWTFKNPSDVFDPAVTINNVAPSTTPANKGHYIVDAFRIDRSVVSGIPGLTTVTTNGERPRTGAFFQGRIFYCGVNDITQHNNIYFSQILESSEQFGKCYQENDPTSEDFFDLLPTDGGVVSIQGAGTIKKMVATKSVLLVFATNGIWAISGSGAEGLGFTANDFTILKLSTIRTITHTSFVEIPDAILWWNIEGIYKLSLGG